MIQGRCLYVIQKGVVLLHLHEEPQNPVLRPPNRVPNVPTVISVISLSPFPVSKQQIAAEHSSAGGFPPLWAFCNAIQALCNHRGEILWKGT